MKNIYPAFALALLLPLIATAQQQPHNTQFMYYKLGYNPGFAGSQEAPCITCIYRQQWTGLDGAPSMQIATFNTPLAGQRVGIGANLMRHTIGITTMYNLDGAYAYRVRMGKGMLGLGVQGSIRSLRHDFNQTMATDPKDQDQSIPGSSTDKFLFNFGTGAYYSSEKAYFGISVPRLLENNIDFTESDVIISREVQHIYMMGGATLPLNNTLKLQPQALLKYVSNSPFDFDANVNLIIENHYVVGLTYRLGGDKENGSGESIDLLLAAQLTRNLMFGMSYDYTLSDIKQVSNGSVEVSLQYCIGKPQSKKDYVNPRFF